MYTKVVFIPIETASRELDYKIYLSIKLSLRGYKVILATKYLINREIMSHKNYVYLDKGYHSQVSDNLYEVIKNRNGQILSLDEEGAVDFINFPTLSNRYSKILLKFADNVFFWGEEQMKHVEELHGASHKYVRTGHPRFQLLQEDFLGLYSKETRNIKIKYGEFILINTNFGFGNNLKGKSFVRQNYKDRITNIDLIVLEDEKKLKACLALIKTLSMKYKVIIRPHPEENEDSYNISANASQPIIVTKEHASIPWIMAATAVVHIDCTTAVEAAILGKKVISYQPKTLDKSRLTVLPRLVSVECHNSIDVMEALNTKTHNNSDIDKVKIENALRSFMSTDLTADTSFDLIMSKINLLENTIKTSTYFNDTLWSIKMTIRLMIKRRTPLQRAKENGLDRSSIKARHDYLTQSIGEKGKSLLSVNRGLYTFTRYEKV